MNPEYKGYKFIKKINEDNILHQIWEEDNTKSPNNRWVLIKEWKELKEWSPPNDHQP